MWYVLLGTNLVQYVEYVNIYILVAVYILCDCLTDIF